MTVIFGTIGSNKNMVKISVIIPAYNVEKYISDCINSVINQTFQDIEIIITDDGSTDRTPEIIEEFCKKNKKIIFLKNNHQGVSAARNTALKHAKGEYISFIDSDDWIDSDFLEKLYEAITEYNCDIACASFIRSRKFKQTVKLLYSEQQIYTSLHDKIKKCGIPHYFYIWNKIYKADLIRDKLFKPNVYFEDICWLPEIIKSAKKIVTVPETNYYYRANNKSIVKSKQTPKKQADAYAAWKYIQDFFRENGLDLPDKNKTITKKIYYLLNQPVIKIKEFENTDIYYIFGIKVFTKINKKKF